VVTRGEGNWLRALVASPPDASYMVRRARRSAVRTARSGSSQSSRPKPKTFASLVDAKLIMAYRIAASGIAMLRVLGSRLDAQMHVSAIVAVRPLDRLRLFSPTVANRETFARHFSTELGILCAAVPIAQEAVEGASIVLARADASFDTLEQNIKVAQTPSGTAASSFCVPIPPTCTRRHRDNYRRSATRPRSP